MTAQPEAVTSPEPVKKSFLTRSRIARVVFWGLAGVLILAIVEGITGTEELTRRGTAGAALRLAMPIMLAGLGIITYIPIISLWFPRLLYGAMF